jgi:hypothetical protein
MKKRKGERKPRPPTATLPATFAEAVEAEIIATLERWFPRIADKITPEFAHSPALSLLAVLPGCCVRRSRISAPGIPEISARPRDPGLPAPRA